MCICNMHGCALMYTHTHTHTQPMAFISVGSYVNLSEIEYIHLPKHRFVFTQHIMIQYVCPIRHFLSSNPIYRITVIYIENQIAVVKCVCSVQRVCVYCRQNKNIISYHGYLKIVQKLKINK